MATIDICDAAANTALPHQEIRQKSSHCVHQNEYEAILSQLCKLDAQPMLITGQRGSGKSHLLRLVQQSTPFSLFIDGQSSNIISFADLLLEVLFQYTHQLALTHQSQAIDLKAKLQTLNLELNDAVITSQMIDLLPALNTCSKPLLLCIDHLPELLKDSDNDFITALSEQLQHGHFSLLASATTPMGKLTPAQKSLLSACRIIPLTSLDTNQCQQLLSSQRPNIDSALTRPLQILSQGSPKALVAMAQSPITELNAPFNAMLRAFHDNYQLHLKAIAPKERKVYLALAALWQPSTTKQVTDKARMDIRAASALLGRLVTKGLVIEQSSNKNGKGKVYALADPLLALYYLSVGDKDNSIAVQSLLKFMTVYYSHKDWAAQRQAILNEQADDSDFASQLLSSTWQQQSLYEGLSQVVDSNKLAIAIGANETLEHWLSAYIQPIDDARQAQDMPALLQSTTKLLEQPVVNQFNLLRCTAKELLSLALASTDKLIAALSSYQELIDEFSASTEPFIQQMVVQSLINMGLCFERLQQYEAASKCYSDAISKTATGHQSHMQRVKACALYLKGHSYQRLEKPASAVNVLARLSNEFAEHLESNIQIIVAHSYLKQGQIWLNLEQHAHGLKSLNKLIESMQQNTLPQVQLCVVKAHLMQSYAYEKQNKMALALEQLDNLLGLWEDKKAPSSRLRQYLADAWLHRAILLFKTGYAAEAMTSLHSVFANSAKHATPSFSALALVTYLAADRQKIPQLLSLFEQNSALIQTSLPLWVALKQELDEPVVAAKEVLLVAEDIRQSIAQNRAMLIAEQAQANAS